MIFPRHHRHVQAVVEHLLHDMPAHLLHALLLQRMDVPRFKRGGRRAMAQVAKHSPADELAANLPLAVILPRVKGTRQLKVEHMTHDLAAHILHVSLLLRVQMPAFKRR